MADQNRFFVVDMNVIEKLIERIRDSVFTNKTHEENLALLERTIMEKPLRPYIEYAWNNAEAFTKATHEDFEQTKLSKDETIKVLCSSTFYYKDSI